MEEKEVETGITLYEMSKQVVKNLPARKTHAELEPCRAILRKFKKLGYFMLMCREENYYTVIHVRKKKNPDKFEDLVIELLQVHGDIKDIDWANNKTKEDLECWVQKDDKVLMFKLFPYSWGVLESE
jgi:hypothetical protein